MVIPELKLPESLEPIEYPESDGKPAAETQAHFNVITMLVTLLTEYFRHVVDVFVAGNLMFYFEKEDPQAGISPDVFVVKGLDKKLRCVYKLWEEGRVPSVAIEITSKGTRLEDKGNKKAVYAAIGVQEYFLFDPLAEYLEPSLQGFRLRGDEYERIVPNNDGSLHSQELGLCLYREGPMLRLYEAATGDKLMTIAELRDELLRMRREQGKGI
jgi:Uma2 family endonuclease